MPDTMQLGLGQNPICMPADEEGLMTFGIPSASNRHNGSEAACASVRIEDRRA